MRQLEVEGGWLLRVEAGEHLPAAVAAFCRDRGIPAATVSGLGALKDVELGYYHVDTRRYERTVLPGSWELLAFTCTVAEWEGVPFAHTHVVISGPDFIARGGHLFDGTVSVTAELRLTVVSRPVRRRMDDTFALHFLDL